MAAVQRVAGAKTSSRARNRPGLPLDQRFPRGVRLQISWAMRVVCTGHFRCNRVRGRRGKGSLLFKEGSPRLYKWEICSGMLVGGLLMSIVGMDHICKCRVGLVIPLPVFLTHNVRNAGNFGNRREALQNGERVPTAGGRKVVSGTGRQEPKEFFSTLPLPPLHFRFCGSTISALGSAASKHCPGKADSRSGKISNPFSPLRGHGT
jgi:hypothetical protein